MKIYELDLNSGAKYRDEDGKEWIAKRNTLFAEDEKEIVDFYNLRAIVEIDFELIAHLKYKELIINDNNPYTCPHCGISEDIEFIGENESRGVEKYSCNTCSKTYTVLHQPRIYDVLDS